MRYGETITVLLPVYNGAPYIEAALRSILAQTYRQFELLIIDDGSDDATPDIVAGFDDPRIRMVRQERSGLGAALNRGLSLARHPWIARMDADDIALPNRLELQARYLERNPGTGVLSSWYAVFEDRRILFAVRTRERHDEIADRLYLHADITHAGCMYRKDLVEEAGGYVNTIAQDYELWNALRARVRFANIPRVLTLVRYNPKSHSRASFIRRNEAMRAIQKRYYGVPSKHAGTAQPLLLCGLGRRQLRVLGECGQQVRDSLFGKLAAGQAVEVDGERIAPEAVRSQQVDRFDV